jgi:GAF domain-containing protein
MGLPGLRSKGPSLQIDPAALAASIGALHDLDLERGLTATLQEIVLAARTLFGADGAGLMLADADGELRWASATDQQSQLVEEDQERLGKGPCRAAFSQRMAIAVQNADTEPDPDGSRSVLRNSGFQAALSVPVELHGGRLAAWICTRLSLGTGMTARSARCRRMPASWPTCSAAPPPLM